MVENMKERWLSVAEIAAHLGVKPDTIYTVSYTHLTLPTNREV